MKLIHTTINEEESTGKNTYLLDDDYIFMCDLVEDEEYLYLIIESLGDRILIPLPIKVSRLEDTRAVLQLFVLTLREMIEDGT